MAEFGYPLLFQPIAVPKVWAGGKLGKIPGRGQSESDQAIGESWDVSTWPTAPDNKYLITVTTITNGPLAGTPLDKVANVPVVVKLIDSGDRLSVQNHPDDADAHKNEMWYVMDADPDAYLYMDLADGVSASWFAELLRQKPPDENAILGALQCHHALKAGAYFTVPAPTVHALGPGLVTFEISERSQVTYRLYDYNRERSRGKLDIDVGCEALMTLKETQPPLDPAIDIKDADCVDKIAEYSTFVVFKVTGSKVTIASAGHQTLITAARGDVRITGPSDDWNMVLPYTFTCLAPRSDYAYTIDLQGSGEVLISPLLD
ncbi:MAG: class I mannose-6-phosphate isomerase [Armatimonadota bacterium]